MRFIISKFRNNEIYYLLFFLVHESTSPHIKVLNRDLARGLPFTVNKLNRSNSILVRL